MMQLVRMGHKGQLGQPAHSRHNLTNGPWRKRRFALRNKHIRRCRREPLQFSQEPQLRPSQRVFRVMSLLDPMHIEITRFEIDLLPP